MNRKRLKKNIADIYLLLILSVISSMLISFTGEKSFKPEEIGFNILSFFQKGITGTANWMIESLNSINELKELRLEYENAVEKIESYNGIERYVIELKRENEALKEQLEFSQSINFENLPVQIIARDPENIFSGIVINKGSKKGIEINSPVTAYQNGMMGLVGKIISVSENTSIVKPINDKSSYVAVRFMDTRFEGLLSGLGDQDDRLLIQYVKKIASPNLNINDLVISSGMKSIFPAGIYIGRIDSITAKEYDSSLDIYIKPVIDFSRLEYLIVLVKEDTAL